MKPDSIRHFFAAIAIAACGSVAHAAIGDQPIVHDTPTGQIAGSLVMPPAGGPVAVALIIAGSGPTDRNGISKALPGANNSLMLLAQALGDAGVASVRYDKRGVGASLAAAPSESEIRFDPFVDAAAAWITKLRRDPPLRYRKNWPYCIVRAFSHTLFRGSSFCRRSASAHSPFLC